MDWTQVRLSTLGRKPLYQDRDGLRLCVRAIARSIRDELLLFSVADDHLHLVLAARLERARRLAQTLFQALTWCAKQPLEPAWVDVVADRAHLLRLIPYLLDQVRHHGLKGEPATFEGSFLQDVEGARVVPGPAVRIRDALPRLSKGHFLDAVGLGSQPLVPLTVRDLGGVGLDRIVDAAHASVCVTPEPRRSDEVRMAARAAVARLAAEGGHPRLLVADALGCTVRNVGFLLDRPREEVLEAAVLRRLALENRALEAAGIRRPAASPTPLTVHPAPRPDRTPAEDPGRSACPLPPPVLERRDPSPRADLPAGRRPPARDP